MSFFLYLCIRFQEWSPKVGYFRLLLPTIKKDANGMRRVACWIGIATLPLSYKAVTINSNTYRIMFIIVRFRYYKAVTPASYIIEFTLDEWREFFWLEDNRLRAGYVLRFLHLERNTTRKEFWWVPIDEYFGIEIKKDAKIYRSASFEEKWRNFALFLIFFSTSDV